MSQNFRTSLATKALCISFFFFFVKQDLAGDAVQNLKEFFGAIYKKVTSDALYSWTFLFSIPISWQFIQIFQVTEADIEEFEAN